MRLLLRRALGLRLALLVVLVLVPVSAHDPFEITTAGTIEADGLVLEVTMTRSSAGALLTGARALRSGFTPEAFPSLRPKLEALGKTLYIAVSRGRTLALQSTLVQLSPEEEVVFVLTYERPEPGSLRLEAKHLERLPEGYGGPIRLQQMSPLTALGFKLLAAEDRVFDALVVDTRPLAMVETNNERTPLKYLVLGVRHILTGYDHLLFLAGLLIASRSAGAMLAVVSCFTLAHSLTLALAALQLLTLPSRVVEPLVAASIVFVAAENLLLQNTPNSLKRQLTVAFTFGLVHGLAFAGGLQIAGVSAADSTLIILCFNVGIELVQIGISIVSLPLLLRLREAPVGPACLRFASIILACAGAYWLFAGDAVAAARSRLGVHIAEQARGNAKSPFERL